MKLKPRLIILLTLFITNTRTAQAITITPIISLSGQSLQVTCNGTPQESICKEFCGQLNRCEIQESECRSCAGTQNLRIKSILDQVGTRIFAGKIAYDSSVLISLLKGRPLITLHSKTLYYFSGVYHSPTLQAQFKAVCGNIGGSAGEKEEGILLLQSNPLTDTPDEILGIVCPTSPEGEARLYPMIKNPN